MSDSKTKIMEATKKALQKHGYTSISIQKIADEFPKSKSLLYHHYDSKDEILLDFMDQTLEKFTENCINNNKDDPKQEIRDKAFIGFKQDKEMMKAMIEIRTQGIRHQKYREKFQSFSKAYKNNIQQTIRKGKKKDLFKDVNAEKAANFIDAVNKEAMFSQATNIQLKTLKEELNHYINHRIIK